jgi:glutathione S-transferase
LNEEIVMSEFIVHTIPGSPFGRAVLTTLEEKGVSWRLSPVAPGTLRSPEHLARHPFGRVPTPRLRLPIPGAPRAWIR